MTVKDIIVLGASAGGVAFMIAMAALLGFRTAAKLDQAELERLAAEEGAKLEAAAIDARGRAAIARLSGGKLLVARVLADGVATRAARPEQVALRLRKGRLTAGFGDLGFPPVSMRLDTPPDWLQTLAGEKR